MVKIIMSGCNGRMGQVITGIVAGDENASIVAGVDINAAKRNDYPVYDNIDSVVEDGDVIIDFLHQNT